jgi:catechol 2,3-dioxygenase-like lactoylglutathione lyase family enzyme
MPIAALGFAHVNLNCRELSRSRRFYEQALGLRAWVHTNPAPQDCSAFGLDAPGQWDAWMLAGADPGSAGALDLLEWLRPRPLPAADARPGRLGLRALGFELPDLETARGRVAACGGRAAQASGALCAAWDPEGAPLWLRAGPHPEPRLAFVELACSDLERSLAFLREVLGLEAGALRRERLAGAAAGGGGEVAWSAVPLTIPGRPDGFRVELTRWETPAPHGRPSQEANRQGLFRLALLAHDLERCHAELKGLGVDGLSAPAWLDLGPDCPAPSCRALFFRDPDGACLELIELPASAPPRRAPA